MFILLIFAIYLVAWPVGIRASNDCAPTTWGSPPARRDATATAVAVVPTMPSIAGNATKLRPGDINCRFYERTYDDANYYSCKEMADKWDLSIPQFFFLNPILLPDCSNIEKNALYCITGFVEPLRSTDGFCGPQHGNATCLGTDAQCCNAETFTCGDTEEDCARGTCYEGACPGDRFYSTDGTCGSLHGDRLCASKWGNCCSLKGRCGTGPEYCGEKVCQSGACQWPWLSNTTSATSSSTVSSSRVSSSSSLVSSSSTSATPIPSPSSHCSDGTGTGGYAGLCSYSCSFGFCPSPCTCTSGNPGTPPPLTGDRGYALLDMDATYGPLCDFACSHGYCPPTACTTIPYSTVQQPGTACVKGSGTGGHAGLCSYCCRYDYCPPGPCTCNLYGQAIAAPPVLNTPGRPAPGIDGSYTGLCSYTCNHGYCPPEVCVYDT